jgi:hypothetical protein
VLPQSLSTRWRHTALVVLSASALLILIPGFWGRALRRDPPPYPRWSCRHLRPPYEETPSSLLERAGFADRNQLRQFTEETFPSLNWTYHLVKLAMVHLETNTLACFRRVSTTQEKTARSEFAEAWVTWRLTSDGRTATAHALAVERLLGSTNSQERLRGCLEREMLQRGVIVENRENRPLVQYDGMVPFYRKFRMGQLETDSNAQNVGGR